MAAATDANIRALVEREPRSPVLEKYAHVGRILTGQLQLPSDEARKLLIQTLSDWTQRLGLPRLRAYGIQESDIPKVVANCRGSSMKTNPVALTDAEVQEVMRLRL